MLSHEAVIYVEPFAGVSSEGACGACPERRLRRSREHSEGSTGAKRQRPPPIRKPPQGRSVRTYLLHPFCAPGVLVIIAAVIYR
jgi:hypothetical protein